MMPPDQWLQGGMIDREITQCLHRPALTMYGLPSSPKFPILVADKAHAHKVGRRIPRGPAPHVEIGYRQRPDFEPDLIAGLSAHLPIRVANLVERHSGDAVAIDIIHHRSTEEIGEAQPGRRYKGLDI